MPYYLNMSHPVVLVCIKQVNMSVRHNCVWLKTISYTFRTSASRHEYTRKYQKCQVQQRIQTET